MGGLLQAARRFLWLLLIVFTSPGFNLGVGNSIILFQAPLSLGVVDALDDLIALTMDHAATAIEANAAKLSADSVVVKSGRCGRKLVSHTS